MFALCQGKNLGGTWVESAAPSGAGDQMATDRVAADAADPSDYWLTDLGAQPMGLRCLFRIARARWRVEEYNAKLKEELDLDHYEGRHWLGWHYYVTLVSLAIAFLLQEQVCIKSF